MISPETIERIRDAARIEDVVGEFVNLRKRGANYIGLCPFHNEKTPSFNVHPVKGIFKCFGCGEGGNPIDFLIKHEQLSYVEALRWLAKKYGIEIREEEMTEEQTAAQELRERLYNLNTFAATFFHQQLKDTEEGKAIALSYCRNRSISDESIEKFQIGYSPGHYDAFVSYAMTQGYDRNILISSGLGSDRNGQLVDRFRGRLIFPIHNISGRILGFGGRILQHDPKRPKYVNSPETEVYQKSKTLYGIFQGRSSIASHDNCYLVEGYTDVTALHQVGISNVVASSGTSLTEEQIRSIRRYTPNITIIYDGDVAGIKASFRGIDMILKEGMNVRIIPMPEGEDPDSFARGHRSSEVSRYFEDHSDNFITFKAGLLKKEAEGDPVKMGQMIREIIGSIAHIPDPLLRPLFVRQCSEITEMEEEQLMYELNRQIRSQRIKTEKGGQEDEPVPVRVAPSQTEGQTTKNNTAYQEDDVIRILIHYGTFPLNVEQEDGSTVSTTVAHEIVHELMADNIKFENPLWQKIYEPFLAGVTQSQEIPDQQYFLHHQDGEIRSAAIDIVSSPYQLSPNWEKRRVHVPLEQELLASAIDTLIGSFRLRKIESMMQKIQQEIASSESEEEKMKMVSRYQKLMYIRKNIAELLGRRITM